MICPITPVCFYLDGFSLESQLKICFTLFAHTSISSFVVKTPGTHHLSYSVPVRVPVGGYHQLRYTDSFFYRPCHPLARDYIPPQKSFGTGLKERNAQVRSGLSLLITAETCHTVSHPLGRSVMRLLLNLNAMICKKEKKSFHNFPFKINFPFSIPTFLCQIPKSCLTCNCLFICVHAASASLPQHTREICLLNIFPVSSSRSPGAANSF